MNVKTDELIRDDVNAELRWDNRLKGVEIGVIVKVIEDVFERRAGRLADRIKISIDGGEVTLNGTVRSKAEKRAVLGAVSHTRGVFSLRDHMAVQNHE